VVKQRQGNSIPFPAGVNRKPSNMTQLFRVHSPKKDGSLCGMFPRIERISLNTDPLILYADKAEQFINERGLRNFFTEDEIAIAKDHFTDGYATAIKDIAKMTKP
jgi:hypothetical protein